MKQIRKGTFETNSSSTHTLVISDYHQDCYIPLAKHIKIEWIDTDDYYILDTLEEKVSYLVSHIANKLKYSCNTYDELLEELQDNYEYSQLKDYIKEVFDKEIRFPNNKNGIYDDIECITEINHQLIPWNSGTPMEEVLDELIEYREDKDGNKLCKENEDNNEMSLKEKLNIYLENGTDIVFGRD